VVIGGGGLCSGVAAALKQVRPRVRTVGVMAVGADSMARSVAAGEPVQVQPRTIADGIALAGPSPLTLAHVQAFVDDLVTVSDDAIARAVLLLAERTKSVVEPAGAAAMAAVLEELVPGDGPVAVVLSGGNIDALLLAKLLEFGLGASGRFLRLVIVVEDRPGALAGLTDLVAALGLNVIDVEHHRAGLRLPLGGVEVVMTVETRDQDHRTEVVGRLRGAGYTVEVDE
jgi:threonine dehydratase